MIIGGMLVGMLCAQWPAYTCAHMCKAKLQVIAGVEFNSCLLNLYRDGSDHMGWHSDNEKLYGDDPTIGKSLLADL